MKTRSNKDKSDATYKKKQTYNTRTEDTSDNKMKKGSHYGRREGRRNNMQKNVQETGGPELSMFTSITNGSLIDHDQTSYTGMATDNGAKEYLNHQKANM